jgi:hypothetical protein
MNSCFLYIWFHSPTYIMFTYILFYYWSMMKFNSCIRDLCRCLRDSQRYFRQGQIYMGAPKRRCEWRVGLPLMQRMCVAKATSTATCKTDQITNVVEIIGFSPIHTFSLGYLTTASVSRLYSVRWRMMGWLKYDEFRYYPRICLNGLRKTTKTPVKVAGAPVDILSTYRMQI